MTRTEALEAAKELYSKFNGGMPLDPQDLLNGRVSRSHWDLYVLVGSLYSQLQSKNPDLRALRRVWDGLLERRRNKLLEPWLRTYGRPMVLLFREMAASAKTEHRERDR